MKVLIINAHQRWENFSEGLLNRTFVELAKKELVSLGHEVRTSAIDDSYNIEDEVEKHVWADSIIVQTPLYWMGSPWLFKKYIDEILTAGLGGTLAYHDGRVIDDPTKKYGTGGVVKGKKIMLSVTSNAPENAFNKDEFFAGADIDSLFLWLHKAYQFNGFESLTGFQAFDVMKNPDIDNDLAKYKAHLNQLFA